MNLTPSLAFKIVSGSGLAFILLLLMYDVGRPVCENPESIMTVGDAFGMLIALAIVWVLGYYSNNK